MDACTSDTERYDAKPEKRIRRKNDDHMAEFAVRSLNCSYF